MSHDNIDKLKDFLKTLDELREEFNLEYKRIGGLKLEATGSIKNSLQQVEEALKIDAMMITQLRKDMTEHFNLLYKEFKAELSEQLTSKEAEVKSKLDSALSNIDKLRIEMETEEKKLAEQIHLELEQKYKARENSLIQKLKEKRKEDQERFKEQILSKEQEMKKDLMGTIENVEKLRQSLTDSSKLLEDEIKSEVLESTKHRERNLIKDLEVKMKSELENLETKYKSRIEILELELQRAQKRIKELRKLKH